MMAEDRPTGPDAASPRSSVPAIVAPRLEYAHEGPPAARSVTLPDPSSASGTRVIRGKLKGALDDMVWQGKPWQAAAQKVGMTSRGMRKALEKPHIKLYLARQRQSFAAGASASNIHRAVELREQDENKIAALGAIKYLDGSPEQQGSIVQQIDIGYVIVLGRRGENQ